MANELLITKTFCIMTKRIFNTRTGRTKEQTVKAYSLFLTIVRQNHDLGQDTSLKQLSMRLHIGSSITNKDLPSDLFTAPYEVVTSLDYAEKWLNEYLRPLRQQRKANTKAKESAKDEPLGGIFESMPVPPEMDEMRKDFNRMWEAAIEFKNKYQL